MINPMNDLTPGIKHSTLHGNHHAHNVYCKSVEIKYGAGILYCNDLYYGVDFDTLDKSKLNHDDRCYEGTLYVEDIYINGSHSQGLNPPKVENDSEQ
ncbi:hypothetical protein AU156_gp153 [Edwardsiella phage PEi20]|uniref:DUF7418 domain-containing protein n=2 Tax=Kanagawavirus pei20 TaxID=2844109 RepID=A0A0B6VRR2_9CAUD|nr:hypothetical protein AU156_gp153 [Edwardsiella phage PEi20]BAQ22949.1 conserved hypothetical protein [Edwardsiella phage PEi20]BAQ23249.1 conserved hypothetical protein [Edwardsiella phage PEi26]